ncbi:MAG: hypothetical protein KY432_10895 [Acidobacteria bacterium]|nr:hypothetical protein [Acidobacteriota bacterium]
MTVFARTAIALFLLMASFTVAADEVQILTRQISLEEIPAPYNWADEVAYRLQTELDFHVDLDLLAPLGTGENNAAVFFRDFARVGGKRAAEIGGRLEGVMYEGVGTGYAFDDAFVAEAEQWIENGTMSFYPEVWNLEGPQTNIPNLLFFMKLGRTWIARGHRAETPQPALDDYRRVIRLGRLVRQDDVTLIQDLIGIALIRLGSEAIYELAREQGDAEAMLIAGLAMQDVAGIRNQTKYRMKNLLWGVEDEEAPIFSLRKWFGNEVEEAEFVLASEIATQSADRRFRFEGIESLGFIMRAGEAKYAKRAKEELIRISKNEKDPLVRELAQWHLEKEAS